MSCATVIVGIKPPAHSRIWRNLAHLRRLLSECYARAHTLCHVKFTASAPQNFAGVYYHFRTPSLGGQHSPSGDLLPAFFSHSWAPFSGRFRRSGRTFGQNGAHPTSIWTDELTGLGSVPTFHASGKENERCDLAHNSPPWWHHLDWRYAAIPSANRPSSVALPSVPQAAWFSAKPISNVVTRTPRLRRFDITDTHHRPAFRQGGVLRLHDQKERPHVQ